jgi:acetyl esterase
MMTIDPDAQRLMDLIRLAGRPRYQDIPVPEGRAAMVAARAVLQPPPVEVADCRDIAIDGADGVIRGRFYRANSATAQGAACLVYYHGGGWVIGDLDTHDGVCRALADAAGCCVISVDYRLAPEHRFPAAVDDAVAAWRWAVREAGSLGVDPRRISIGGDSAGANLATVVALTARDEGLPMPVAQVLVYPVTDLAAVHDSHQRVTEGVPLTAGLMLWFRDHYLAKPGHQLDWRASPLRAAHLRDLPPAFVLTAGFDPLCDEGIAYARRLAQDGCQVTHLHLPNQVHGFLTMGRIIRAAGFAIETIGGFLRRLPGANGVQ